MLTVVGAGPAGMDYMSYKAVKILSKADNIYAFKRVKLYLEKEIKNIKEISISEIKDIDFKKGRNIMLLSGDPCFFGAVEYIKKIGIKIDEIIPSITSFQYLFSKIQLPWGYAKTYSLHGRKLDENFLKVLSENKKLIVLSDKINNSYTIAQFLIKNNIERKMIIGSSLAMNEEKIKFFDKPCDCDLKEDFAVVYIYDLD